MSINRLAFVFILFANIATYSQFNNAPHFSESIQYISEFVASTEFKEFSDSTNAMLVVDSLYSFALKFCNGNISETLLSLTFVTLPFYEMPLSIPLISDNLRIPLPAATKAVFDKKQLNLPKNIFFEISKISDQDKLAHFFGNAYLTHMTDSFNLSEFMSIFVELFEHTFKVEGAIDYRDLVVNSLGNTFGNFLHSNEETLPSEVLKLYYLYHLHPGY